MFSSFVVKHVLAKAVVSGLLLIPQTKEDECCGTSNETYAREDALPENLALDGALVDADVIQAATEV